MAPFGRDQTRPCKFNNNIEWKSSKRKVKLQFSPGGSMFKRFLKFLLRMVLSFVALLILLAVVTAWTMSPKVRDNSALILDITGPIPEEGPQDWRTKLLVGDILTMRGILRSLEKAETDDRIRAVIVNSTFARIGPAKAQEIRSAIKRFAARSKKPVIGFLEDGGTIDYYICSAAPKLYLPPQSDSWFTLIGLRAEMPFYKGTLDKLGVQAQMEHIGMYKSGSETYTRESMSEPDREQTNALLDSLYQRIVNDIAQDRKLAPDVVRSLIDQSPLVSDELKSKGLVDDLLYRDQLEGSIKKDLKLGELNTVSALEYQKPSFTDAFSTKPDKIALIYATGTIVPGESYRGFGEEFLGSGTVSQSFQHARDDESVKAVVFRVDSPGGSPSASDVIWREVQVTAQRKPVVVSMADVAASGGYYVAMGATKIFADPSTITGSIGVYGGKFYLKGLYDKIGVKKEIVKKGKNADLFSDYVPYEEEDWAIIKKHMANTYDAFTRKAAQGRKKTQQQIHAIAQGRVWSGDQARALGLVDAIGGMMDAIQEARKLARIGDFSYSIYPSSRAGDLTEMISEETFDLPLSSEIKRALALVRVAEKEPVLLWMPYRIFVD
jgi:protease IV